MASCAYYQAMEHLKNFLVGLGEALSMTPQPRGYRIDQHGFQADAANLRGDFAKVGADMRAALKRDQSTNQRPRKGE